MAAAGVRVVAVAVRVVVAAAGVRVVVVAAGVRVVGILVRGRENWLRRWWPSTAWPR